MHKIWGISFHRCEFEKLTEIKLIPISVLQSIQTIRYELYVNIMLCGLQERKLLSK